MEPHNDDRFSAARQVLEQGVAGGAYAGAVGLVLHHGAVAAELVVGHAALAPERRPLRADTIFDLASVTKVVAGVSAVLLGLDRGLWSLDDPVALFIPAFGRRGKEAITIRHLLTHTSGLPAWTPLYAWARSTEEALPVLCDRDLEAAPGARVLYSDLGMALVAYLVARVFGEPLSDLLARELFGPLGMVDTCYLPSPAARERCAATSVGNEHEVEMVARAGQAFDGWRRHLLLGEVHDGNTHYALGGVSSHAGLFSTAPDLARFAALYLGEGVYAGRRVFSAAAVRAATRAHTTHPGIPFGLGWRIAGQPMLAPDGPPEPDSFMGDLVSLRASGHTGFTGTSLVLDPERDLAMVLLTNAVHTDPSRDGIARVRPRFHNAVCAAVA